MQKTIINKLDLSAYMVKEALQQIKSTYMDLCEDAFVIKELIALENYLKNKYLKIEEDAEITDIYVAVETENNG